MVKNGHFGRGKREALSTKKREHFSFPVQLSIFSQVRLFVEICKWPLGQPQDVSRWQPSTTSTMRPRSCQWKHTARCYLSNSYSPPQNPTIPTTQPPSIRPSRTMMESLATKFQNGIFFIYSNLINLFITCWRSAICLSISSRIDDFSDRSWSPSLYYYYYYPGVNRRKVTYYPSTLSPLNGRF